jgi:hypothetical protein
VTSFQKDYGVQTYLRHDPAPHLRFSNTWEPPRHSRLEVWVARAVWVAIGLLFILVESLSK